MNSSDLEASQARSLGKIFALAGEDSELWTAHELAAILRHQLAAEVKADLADVAPVAIFEKLLDAASPPIRTFRDLFDHPRPPPEILELTRRFAQSCQERPDCPLPRELAALLDILCALVARIRGGRAAEPAGDETLGGRIQWALAQPWIDEATRDLLREGILALNAKSVSSRPLDTDVVPARGTPENAVPSQAVALEDGSSLAAIPLEQLGEYRLLGKLGEGGMGSVYKARHTELDRLVAIKVLRGGLVQEDWAVARFRREIQASGRVDHPNVVRALDARRVGNTHFLVMEYVDGLNLAEVVHRQGPLPVADACETIRQAASGLQCACEHGLVHRDIKPSNLMLDHNGRVKILDLGLARILGGAASVRATTCGLILGTPDYMAPEQFADSHATDARGDIYSLGCTLYHLLADRPPFFGCGQGTPLEKMHSHAAQQVPPLGQFRSDVPEGVTLIVNRMLAKSPDERYPSAQELAEAIAPYAVGSDLPGLLARAEGRVAPAPVGGAAASPASAEEHPSAALSGQTVPLPPATNLKKSKSRRIGIALAATLLTVAGAIAVWNHFPTEPRGPSDSVPPEDAAPAAAAVTPLDTGTLPGWIVLSWAAGGMGKPHLWLMRPSGRPCLSLTDDPHSFDIHPKFSPDGRRITFIRGTELGEPTSVWICNADGTGSRQVVSPQGRAERLASPLWVSNSRICYVKDPKLDRQADAEVWQSDVDSGSPQRVFRLQEAIGKGIGVITDRSPDGRHLVLVAQDSAVRATADVFLCDLQGKNTQTLWSDEPEQRRDARALWSPDGNRIAWHHDFMDAGSEAARHFGIGMARLREDGRWATELQGGPHGCTTPLAWSPQGNWLLCARLKTTGQGPAKTVLYFMDEHFRPAQDILEMEGAAWMMGQRDPGRWADWAVVPANMALPGPLRPPRHRYP